ncbi:MAG: S41 family peptidase, partial [Planctomycetota bacterium]|nr:S41 family peptidase [Planctomycetota bacterium]
DQAGGANGLIFDLRYNPGGLLISAVQISNLFVEQGTIVSAEDKNGKNTFPPQQASKHRAKLAGLPTVVLINKGSASASEIVAGCLQAHGAAVIVGERSYGKGSVQTIHVTDRNAQMKLTTQYYRLPPNRRKGEVKGRLVHKRPNQKMWGVDPDILVKMTPKQIEDTYYLR